MRRPAQALVEFAFAISLFLLLVLGTFDLARAYLVYTVVTNTAREASRSGAAHCCVIGWDRDARQAGLNLAVGVDQSTLGLIPTCTTVAGVVLTGCTSTGPVYVTVKASYLFHSLTPLVGALLGDPITIVASTTTPVG